MILYPSPARADKWKQTIQNHGYRIIFQKRSVLHAKFRSASVPNIRSEKGAAARIDLSVPPRCVHASGYGFFRTTKKTWLNGNAFTVV